MLVRRALPSQLFKRWTVKRQYSKNTVEVKISFVLIKHVSKWNEKKDKEAIKLQVKINK